MSAVSRRTRTQGHQAGFTLVELLVGLSLFSVLGSVVLGIVLATNSSAQNGRANASLTEQARVAVNRIARDVRQARTVDAVFPVGVGSSGLTISVDFNRSGAIEPVTAATAPEDAEQLTYCYRADQRQVLVRPGLADCGTVTGPPVLAANVTDFQLTYTSSYERSGVALQTVSPAAAGLTTVDGITVAMTVQGSGHTQTFRTAIDLRNR